jgi:hypothetical protein
VLLGVIARDPLLRVRAGTGKLGEIQQVFREHPMGPHHEPGIPEALRQAEELFPQLVPRPELPPHELIPPQAHQRGEELRGVAELPGELARSGIGGRHFRRRMPLSQD